MKKFNELKRGDFLYILKSNLFENKLEYIKASVESVSPSASSVSFKSPKINGKIYVDVYKSEHTVLHRMNGDENYYSTDRLLVESRLKKFLDSISELESKVDNVYADLWKTEEEKLEELGLIPCEIYFSETSQKSGIYTEGKNLVMSSGYIYANHLLSDLELRLATEEERNKFFRECIRTILMCDDDLDSSISTRLVAVLSSCGYKFENNRITKYEVV